MPIFAPLLRADSSNDPAPRGPLDDYWFKPIGTATHTGLAVTPSNALEVSAVFACIKVIAETIAMLPLYLYRRIDDKAKEKATDDPLYWILHTTPNQYQTDYEFRETLTAWAALHGMAYAYKIFNPLTGALEELVPLHPSLVTPEYLPGTRRLRYQVMQPDGTKKPYTQDEIFCVRGFGVDGIQGLVMSRQARQAIAIAQGMEMFSGRYFANDTTVGMILSHPNQLSKEAQKRLEESFTEAHGGASNAHKVKVIEEGMTASRMQINAEQAQLVDGRLLQVVEICRFFRMQPHKIAHLIQATFSNIEHQSIEHVSDTIQPWATRWEKAISRDLILDPADYFAQFNLAALMRGDSAARAAYYKERFNMGSLSPNDIRALENENPEPGGDRFYVNSATVPLDDDGIPVMPAPATPPSDPTTSAPDPADPADPAEPAEPADKTPADKSTSASAAFRVLVADAADRIARVEASAIAERIAYRAKDTPRFMTWAREFYIKHETYIFKTLTPLATAWEAAGNAPTDARAAAEEIAGVGEENLIAPTFAFGFDDFIAARRTATTAFLTHAFNLG